MKNYLFFLLILGMSFTYSFAQSEEILFTVGDEPVTKQEFINSYQKNNLLSKAVREDLEDYLNLYINFKLKVREGKELQLDTALDFVKEFQAYRKQSAQQYLIDKNLSDKLLNEAKDRLQHYIRSSHIMIACPLMASPKDSLVAYNKILKIRDKILNKEISFADAAVKYSDDISARDTINPVTHKKQAGNKGDLGYCTAFNLIYTFESKMYNTPVGAISMPVRSEYGYHIIYVEDEIPAIKDIEVAQIFVADTNALAGVVSLKSKNKLDQIEKAIQDGVSFDSVVMIYSEDYYSKANKGVLEPFAPNRRTGNFVKSAIDLKVGEISKPIPTILGWHIIKLIKVNPVEMNSDELDFMVKNKTARDPRSHLSKSSLIYKLKKEYNYNEDGKKGAIDFFVKKTPEQFYTGNSFDLTTLKGIEKLKPIASYADKTVMAEDFADYMNRFKGVNVPKEERQKFFLERYAAFLEENMLKYEDSKLEKKYPEFKDLMDEYVNGMMLYQLNAEKVWEKAIKDTVGLVEFYENIKTEYPADQPGTCKPIGEIKSIIISRYQDFLDNEWITELKKKNPIKINQSVFDSILKK